MFDQRHFHYLEAAIDGVTRRSSGEDTKHGLIHKLLYLIRTAAAIIKATHQTELRDTEDDEVEYFLEMLKLHQSSIFGDAAYTILEQLANEELVKKLILSLLRSKSCQMHSASLMPMHLLPCVMQSVQG